MRVQKHHTNASLSMKPFANKKRKSLAQIIIAGCDFAYAFLLVSRNQDMCADGCSNKLLAVLYFNPDYSKEEDEVLHEFTILPHVLILICISIS